MSECESDEESQEECDGDEYGERMNRYEQEVRFPSPKPQGINHNGKDVQFIKLVMKNARNRFPNQVFKDKIYYCHKNEHDKSDIMCNDIMRQTITTKNAFRVLIVDGNTSYDWGHGVVEKENKSILKYGILHKRFVVRRVLQVEQNESKKRHREEETRTMRSRCTFFDGIWYDSLLEAKHALWFSVLGLKFKREPITLHIDIVPHYLGGGLNSQYRADFYIEDLDSYVEIKPKLPYDIEEYKCIELCRHTRKNVILFYNDKFEIPYRISSSNQDTTRYSHSDAVRGILYSYEPVEKNVKIKRDVIWVCRNDEFNVDTRIDLEDRSHTAPKLLDAYSEFGKRVILEDTFVFDTLK